MEGQQHACTGFYTPGKHITQLCSARCDLIASDVRQVLSMLAPQRKAIYAQRNYFFDSPDGRVSKFRRTLRIRFFDDDKAVLTIKVCLGPVTGHFWDAVRLCLQRLADMLCLLHEKRLLKGAKCEGMTLLCTLQGRQEMKDGVGRATEVRHTIAYTCGTVQPPRTAVYDHGHCTRAFTEPEVNHLSLR